MANQLDELNPEVREEGVDTNVIAKKLPVEVGVGSKIFEILLWVCGIIPGVIFLFKKIKRSTKQVIINMFYAKDISRRIVNLGYTRLIEHFVLTMLHEHRHAWQWFNNDETTKTPLVDSKKDYEGYWMHPMEVDARNTSEKYMAEAMEYLVSKLRSSYLNPAIENHLVVMTLQI